MRTVSTEIRSTIEKTVENGRLKTSCGDDDDGVGVSRCYQYVKFQYYFSSTAVNLF